MRAHAEIRVALRGGVSRLVRLSGAPPLLARETRQPPGARSVQMHLVTGAGGPCVGDELSMRIVVAAGASLDLCSVGATVALPGTDPAAPASRLRTTVEVEEDATLRWLPEPVVAAKGCDHEVVTVVRLAPTATLLLREELVRGRTGELPGGRLVSRLRVERDDVPVLDQEVTLDATAVGVRTVGTLLSVGPWPGPWDEGFSVLTGPDSAVSALAQPGAYAASALAPDTVALRRALDHACVEITAAAGMKALSERL